MLGRGAPRLACPLGNTRRRPPPRLRRRATPHPLAGSGVQATVILATIPPGHPTARISHARSESGLTAPVRSDPLTCRYRSAPFGANGLGQPS